MGDVQLSKSTSQAWLLVLAASGVLGANAGCEKAPPRPAVPVERSSRFLQEIPFQGGTEWLHTCGGNLAAVARERDVYVWDWADLGTPPIRGKGEGGVAMAFMLPDLIVTTRSELNRLDPDDRSYPLILKNMRSGVELRRWNLGPAWYCERMRTSQNGRWVAIGSESNVGTIVRPGLLEPASEEPRWVAEFAQKRGTLMASRVAPSEDGRYIAVVGIHDGAWIAVADVEAKKVLWDKRQDGAGGFDGVAFSPDSQTVYAGGTCGGLFGYDLAKGKVTGRWLMGEGLDTKYGYRITQVAASLDGQLISAGTGPRGDVYLWNVKTGKQVAVLHTRQATIMGLTFSPDSSRLAVTGVENRSIEIWDVTEK